MHRTHQTRSGLAPVPGSSPVRATVGSTGVHVSSRAPLGFRSAASCAAGLLYSALAPTKCRPRHSSNPLTCLSGARPLGHQRRSMPVSGKSSGPLSPPRVRQLWVARVVAVYASPKSLVRARSTRSRLPATGTARARHELSTKSMRESYDPIIAACEALSKAGDEHVENTATASRPAHGCTRPLRETIQLRRLRRGASVRIPWQVEVDGRATSRIVAQREYGPSL